jgi:adenylate cyclase
MADLIAQGPNPEDHWRKPLPDDQRLVLGRDAGPWSVPWDSFISRHHAELICQKGQLEVRSLSPVRNPIFHRGQVQSMFAVAPGEHFVIGRTTFTLLADDSQARSDERPLVAERTISAQELKQLHFRDAPRRLDVLSRLPEVIARAANDPELSVGLINMVLAGIPRADAAALVVAEPTEENSIAVQVLHQDSRLAGQAFQPSRRLVRQAVDSQQTVLHVRGAANAAHAGTLNLTQAGDFDWAFCTPVRGEACKGWAIYVTGRLSPESAATIRDPWETNELGDDLKFTELAAALLHSLRQVQRLQRNQASLRQFFSPAVVRGLADDPDVVLKPHEADVTVLFCDLRGFSRESEKHKDLMALLQRVSKALGVMTQNILDQGGVIGDFQGDSAMGFWGWPLAQSDRVKRACLAALAIRTMFEAKARHPEHPLAGFQVGIGIASGRAVAGGIGSIDQVKITVFGPTVNLASRLEGMTKILGTSILLDEETARLARQQIPTSIARCRRLAQVRPYGMGNALEVSELVPPVSEYPVLTDDHLMDYELGLDAFVVGNWDTALKCFSRLPVEDCSKDYVMNFIYSNRRVPPAGWKGIIELASKS